MGREVYERYPEAREAFRRAEEGSGLPLRRLAFEGPEEELVPTEVQQPAILATSLAVYAVLAARGLAPSAFAGLSLGEYSALVAAGALSLEEAAWLVRRRGRYMQEAAPPGEGAMAAVLGLDDEAVEAACREAGPDVVPANYNCPGQVVVSGRREAVERAAELCRARGARRVQFLSVSAPFHSPFMEPAARRLAADLARVALRDPEVPVVANVDARPKTTAEEVRRALVRQVASAVRWSDGVRALKALGARRLLEVGPGRALSGFARRIDPELAAVACGTPEEIEAVLAGGEGGR
ncbi:MAG: ACP S-malonyltransferase [Clostridia bacterium]|nr:ACP S-malonyltransferase [Clostridia bacterium]